MGIIKIANKFIITHKQDTSLLFILTKFYICILVGLLLVNMPYNGYLPGYTINEDEIQVRSIWDSHCHIGLMEEELNARGITNGEDLRINIDYQDSGKNDKVGGVIANFANPDYWSGGSHWDEIHPVLQNCWEQERTYVTLGCHPKLAYKLLEDGKGRKDFNVEKFAQLERLIVDPTKRIVAIGEIGLDLSSRNRVPLHIQKIVFKLLIDLAVKYHLPLVFHI